MIPLLCAHRGLSRVCPENTLPAFGAAIALEVHEIEFDLWMSADGVPVVCHDASVDRTTDGTGNIGEMRWEEIRGLDAGVVCGDGWRGVRIPRFEDILRFAAGAVGLNIHIKHPGPDGSLVRLVCDALRERTLLDTAYVAGEENVLRVARAYSSDVVLACLGAQDNPARQVSIALEHGCRRIQFGRGVSEKTIRMARDAGLVCNLFYSDEPADARAYVERGIDVILTNCANILIAGGLAC